MNTVMTLIVQLCAILIILPALGMIVGRKEMALKILRWEYKTLSKITLWVLNQGLKAGGDVLHYLARKCQTKKKP